MTNATIGVLVPTYNEEANVRPLYNALKEVFDGLIPDIKFRVLFIDNDSKDQTRDILMQLAREHKEVSCIFNERNYGANRSLFHGILECPGDAVIMMCADFQDPPHLIPEFVEKWQNGHPVVMAKKSNSNEHFGYKVLRKSYYKILGFSHPMYKDVDGCTGYGIYDRTVLDKLKTVNDKTPFFRGLVAEFCSSIEHIRYTRPTRAAGRSSMNLYRLWDEGIVGLINNSQIGIRIIAFLGFTFAMTALTTAVVVLTLKLFYWEQFLLGILPIILIQIFSLGCVMFAIGLLGEYVCGIYTQVLGRERVYEKQRINL